MGPARSERPREGAAAPRRAPPDPDPRSRSSTRGDRRRIPSARRPSAAVLGSDAGKERRVSKRCRGRGSPPGLSPRLRGDGWQLRAAARAVLPGSRSGGDPRGVFLSGGLSASTAKTPLERKKYAATFGTVAVSADLSPRTAGHSSVFSGLAAPHGCSTARCSRSGGTPAALRPFPRSSGHARPPATFSPRSAERPPSTALPPSHRAAPDCPPAPTLRPRINVPAVIFKDFWEPFAL